MPENIRLDNILVVTYLILTHNQNHLMIPKLEELYLYRLIEI